MIPGLGTLAGGALGILGRIPLLWWVVIGLAALAWWNRAQFKSERAEFERAKVVAAAERAASQAEAAAETARRLAEQKGIADAANQNQARLRAAVAARGAVADQLRARLAALEAVSCGADPAAPDRSASAAEAADLHAYVSRRLDEARGGVAEFAEGAAIAGTACEQSYDSLKGRAP